ncbi:MAG: hypothetical protein ACXWN4_08315 [Candidatus Limnocylindrales bacterium]
MLHLSIRALAFGLGLLMFLGGVATLSLGGPEGLTGAWIILVGSVFMIGSILQRSRYRSDAAERSNVDPGPGGGETGWLEPRFVPTTELFVDPTSHRLMRVYIDSRTGERRYKAET